VSEQLPVEQPLWVQRVSNLEGHGLWVVCEGDPAIVRARPVEEWQAAAERRMAERAEVASLSVVAPDILAGHAPGWFTVGATVQAAAAALPLTFLSGRTADLIGITEADDQSFCSRARFGGWVESATLKGLVHQWLVVDPARLREAGLSPLGSTVPPGIRETALFAEPDGAQSRISLGIDAAWLADTESGAQVALVEMVRELASRPEIDRIVLISDTGGVPDRCSGLTKVSGRSWLDALAAGSPTLDVMHRPYQPGLDVDYRRYHRVAKCVAVTVLDLIVYDNPDYHESVWSWRHYQQTFQENVCLADCVFAISQYVASRLEHQFAHQLSGPVRPVPLGTDHLARPDAGKSDPQAPALRELQHTPFLLVLGNDFEHKNRDFAVRVFADMRDRGYQGRLVLAGFHLDAGSSFGHELSGAGPHLQSVIRIGSVSTADKAWLLRHAEVVLYPTSSEGFGIVPFEAAALGTPTAFVAFGPLREMLEGVDSCTGWQVRAFADHVFRLLRNPEVQVGQIRAAGAARTWALHVDQVLDGYRHVLREGAPWRTRARSLSGRATRLRRAIAVLAHRVDDKLRRLAGRIL
jgi:glycosyltransferase involved in cell wall biosynthesis